MKKSVLLWYSPQEMYDLVTGIEQYPAFLPWCDRAEVLERHDTGVTARLGLHYMGVRHAFTTRNEHVGSQSVVVRLVDGPFSLLDGTWQSGNVWGGVREGMIEVTGFGSKVPKAVQQEVLARQKDIALGRLHPFHAKQPVRGQQGQTLIAKGQTLSDAQILAMNWLVQGVQAKLP